MVVSSSAVWSAAVAQTSAVTLYGSIDEGITYVNNQAGGAAWMTGVVAVPDKFGFKGTEDLGGGTSAIFQLENGFFSNTGTFASSGTMFNRHAWVGLSSKRAGVLTLGRQWDLSNEVFTPNANGAVEYNNYLYHPGNLDNSAVTPVNNSIRYTTPRFGGWFAQGMYAFRDTSSGQGRYVGATLRYSAGPLDAGFVYSDTNGRTYALKTLLGYASFMGQDFSGGASFRARNTTIMGLAGTYRVTPRWAVHGILDHVRIETDVRSTTAYNAELGIEWRVTAANAITLGGFRGGVDGRQYTTVGIADLYHLSVRTMVYAEATTQFTSRGTGATLPSLTSSSNSHQLALRIGVQHFF